LGASELLEKITGSTVRYYGSPIRDGVPTVKKTLSVSSSIVAAKDQVSSDLGDEVAILHLKAGVYYGLDGVGARIWDLIQEPRTVEEVRDVLVSEYEVEPDRCESDLITLLQRLADEGLIEVIDGTFT
jgi:hypothetical protein